MGYLLIGGVALFMIVYFPIPSLVTILFAVAYPFLMAQIASLITITGAIVGYIAGLLVSVYLSWSMIPHDFTLLLYGLGATAIGIWAAVEGFEI